MGREHAEALTLESLPALEAAVRNREPLTRQRVPVLETAVADGVRWHARVPSQLRSDPRRVGTALLDVQQHMRAVAIGRETQDLIDFEVARLSADTAAHHRRAGCQG